MRTRRQAATAGTCPSLRLKLWKFSKIGKKERSKQESLKVAEGVDTNLDMALDYYKKAATGMAGKFGNADAIKNIAAYYESGIVYEKSNAKALEWYLKAKQAGNQFVDEDIQRVREKLNQK